MVQRCEFPPSVDPCGERGEFHSFAYGGPMFRTPITVTLGKIVNRDGFTFADVKPMWDPFNDQKTQ